MIDWLLEHNSKFEQRLDKRLRDLRVSVTNGVDRDGKCHWSDVPVDAYAASGHGGPRVLAVTPSLDLIAS